MSLGVDLVPKKVCSLDCVYCEVGKTTKLTTQRMEYIPYDKVVGELEHYFKHNPDPDYITFSGSGEPTLNSRLGDVLDYIKQQKPGIPVAVLTNGTLLYDEQVRKELRDADVVLPSLDAASDEAFKKINRPAGDLSINRCIDGLVAFRKEFTGKIWLEIFILPSYNDDDDELLKLKSVIDRIQPDSVQLNTLDRPGTVDGLQAATLQNLERIVNQWGLKQVEIIAAAVQRKTNKAFRNDMESAILETISRRPCTLDDLKEILGLHVNEINKYLDVLEATQKIEAVRQTRGVFYQLKGSGE
jgi:wyosine [tRNA(Phe)-imidazoG37] synthetase (radical SAM superfamily)